MLFADFTASLNKLEKISSRNEMTEVLAELFSKLEADEIKQALYLLSGRVSPSFLAIEFNFSIKLSLRAIATMVKQGDDKITDEYKKIGDIGEFTEKKLIEYGKQVDKHLSINEVFTKLEEIAFTNGKNSQLEKQQLFNALLIQVSPVEAKYISRIVVGKLRLGLSNKTIFDALSWAVKGDKSLRDLIEYAYGVSVDIGEIAKTTLTKGEKALQDVHAQPGIPVASKLVEREKDAESVIERLGTCFIQPKFDGLRVQIHYNKKGFDSGEKKKTELNLFNEKSEKEYVRIFSRNLEELTAMFPDVVEAVKKLPVDNIILDGEAIGFDEAEDSFLAFQETIKRKRKHDVKQTSLDVPLQVNLFDILYLNGEDLLTEKIEVRIKKLEQVFGKQAYTNPLGMFKLAETTSVDNAKDLQKLFDKYVKMNLEGIIAKDDDTLYKPGSRNFDWIKLKASSDKDLVDTIDAVVLGYYYGTGVRAKFGIGAILIGVYDRDNDKYVSLTKVGTGFKDKDWKKIKPALDEIRIKAMPDNYVINKQLQPDVIVSPKIVIEVEADSISISTIHGKETEESYSLRFPRIKVFGRDKQPQDATTVAELKQMYSFQQGKSK